MKYTTSGSNRRLLHRASAWLVTLSVVALGGWACDGSKVVRHGPNNGAANNGTNNGDGDLTENGTDDAGHGPDEDQELIEPGFMTGSWRVGNGEDNALIANFDLIQEANNTTVEGIYTMGGGLYDRLDEKSGDMSTESTYSDDTLTLKWNPTDVPNEMYTITAQKQDDDTFIGRLTAIDYEQLDREVVITRYHFEGNPGGDEGDGTTAGDIDAGPQGGAGSQDYDAGM